MYFYEKNKEYVREATSLDKYSIEAFGESFGVIPRTIMENSWIDANEKLNILRARNSISTTQACWIGLI